MERQAEIDRLWARIKRLREAIHWYDDAYAGEYGGKGDTPSGIERDECLDLEAGDMTEEPAGQPSGGV